MWAAVKLLYNIGYKIGVDKSNISSASSLKSFNTF